MKWCEIFRTGTHTDSKGNSREWTEADLQQICSNFESKNPDVPICVGHPKTSSPAYGWIESLKLIGGKLYASFKDVQPEFQEAVNKGLFKTRSISLTGDLVPRHIAFLGAQAPAIKGMEQFCFAESEDDLYIEFNEANVNDDTESEQSEPNAEGGAPSASLKGEQMTQELEKQLAAKDEELAAMRKELEETRQDALKKEFEEFCDNAIADGNILPAQRENVLNLLFANTDSNINFDDGSSKTSNEVFKDFVKSLRQMNFRQVSNEKDVLPDKEINFSDAEDVKESIQALQKEYENKGIELNPAQALDKLKG